MDVKKALFVNGVMALLIASMMIFVSRGAVAQQNPNILIIGLEFPNTPAIDPSTGLPNRHFQEGRDLFDPNIIQVDSSGNRTFNNVADNFVFGSGRQTVRGYFLEVSYQQMDLVNAGIFGPYQAQFSANEYWDEKALECEPDKTKDYAADCTDADGDGWHEGHQQKANEAINTFISQEIDTGNFDLASYDSNIDGVVTPDELYVVVIFPQNRAYGTARPIPTTPQGSNYVFSADSISWDLSKSAEVYVNTMDSDWEIHMFAEELAHVMIDAEDMYEKPDTYNNYNPPGWDPTSPGPFTLPEDDLAISHLDPAHKIIRAQWVQPFIVEHDGYYDVHAVENSPTVFQLGDPTRNLSEYFLVENRQLLGFDNFLPDEGLAIWHIDRDAEEEYGGWRAMVEIEPRVWHPNNRHPTDCAAVGPCTRYDRSVYSDYLWASSALTETLDWWHESNTVDSKWRDGSKSLIGAWAIPPSAPTMKVYFDVPGPGILAQLLPRSAETVPGVPGSFKIRLVNTGSSSDVFKLSVSGLEDTFPQLSEETVVLGSYEEKTIDLDVNPSKCTAEGTYIFSVKAESVSNSKVATVDKGKLLLKIPNWPVTADKFEPNDQPHNASVVALGGTTTGTESAVNGLTLHDGSDVDYFRIEFASNPTLECAGTKSHAWSTQGGMVVDYRPGNLSLEISEEYCRSIPVAIYYSDGELYNKYYTNEPILIDCPTDVFSDNVAYLSVEDVLDRTLRYDLSVGYTNWFATLSRLQYQPPKILVRSYFEPPIFVERPLRILAEPLARERPRRVYGPDSLSRNIGQITGVMEDRNIAERAEQLYVIGQLYATIDEFAEAERYYQNGLALFREISHEARMADVHRGVAELYSKLGRVREAREKFEAVIESRKDIEDHIGLRADYLALAWHFARQSKHPDALAVLEEAMNLEGATLDEEARAGSLLLQADSFLELGLEEAAIASLFLVQTGARGPREPSMERELERRLESISRQIGREQYERTAVRLAKNAEAVRIEGLSRAGVR